MEYKFVKHINQGGFGIVDEVIDKNGNSFARKKFELDQNMKDQGMESNAKKRFIQEAIIQSEFQHKNIVPILELYLDQDPPYYIMPLAVSTLDQDYRTHKIDSNNFLKPVNDVLSGLEEMHLIDVFHRDLKPGNILRFLDEDGEEFYAIGDFGLISLRQRTGISNLTTTGMKKGSDFYTAPEITQDLRNASAATDIYSVGCIIHDVVGTDERIPCSTIEETSDYSHFLEICTRKNPAKRFSSVGALRDVLMSLEVDTVISSNEKFTKLNEYLDRETESLTDREIGEIIDFIDASTDRTETLGIFLSIQLKHIDTIRESTLFNKFCGSYLSVLRDYSFQFESCDALANRALRLVADKPIGNIVEALISLLYLGTSHNRWYVERKFANKIDKTADSNMMRRLAMEFAVEGKKVCEAINHLKYSINLTNNDFHPLISAAVEKFCK
ncbi:protein kinase domain-containing protein [Pedobacter agri]|uniref:protein kinase domain-containing protein n=1 Tax=Pedobacter agri TaxID=454586 RepID=UPI00292CF41B|nr:protein kinase [Pedobacter agri]